MPPGVFSALGRVARSPRDAARYVIGAARDHGQARAATGAAVDFPLTGADAAFMRVPADADDPESGGARVPDQRPAEVRTSTATDLANRLLTILARLDDVRGRAGLLGFVDSEAHGQLVHWFRTVSDELKHHDADRLDGETLRRLAAAVNEGRPKGFGSMTIPAAVAAVDTPSPPRR